MNKFLPVFISLVLLLSSTSSMAQPVSYHSPPQLQTSQFQLTSFSQQPGNNNHLMQHYQISSEIQIGEKIVAAVRDYTMLSPKQHSFGGWKLQVLQVNSGYKIQLTQMQEKIYIATISLLKIGKNWQKYILVFEPIWVRENYYIKSLSQSILLTVSKDNTKQTLGYSAKKEEITQFKLFTFISGLTNEASSQPTSIFLHQNVIKQNHIHLQSQLQNVKDYTFTLCLIYHSQLQKQHIILFSSIHIMKKQQANKMILLRNSNIFFGLMGVTKQQKQLNDSTITQFKDLTEYGQLQFKLLVCPINTFWIVGTQQCSTQQQNIRKENQYEIDFTQNRRLSPTCIEGPVACPVNYFYATACWIDTSCKKWITDCGYGYYAAANYVTSCSTCSPTLSNCLDCTRLWYSTSPTCVVCAASYYITTTGKCALCPSTCTTCKLKLVLTYTVITCLTCATNLTIQTSGSVSICGCKTNQYLSPVSPPICINCPTGCQTCKLNGTVICTACLTGFFNTSPTCTACMPVCKTCLTALTCVTCINNLVLVAGQCTCPTNWLEPISLTCLDCATIQPNCQTCDYNLVYTPTAPTSVICISTGPGFYISGGVTVACLTNCVSCTDSITCITCLPTFTYIGSSCICNDSALPNSLYLAVATNTCQVCTIAIPGCDSISCINSGGTAFCSLCIAGYYPPTAYSVANCASCPPLCTACSSALICTTCISNLTVLSTQMCGCDVNASRYYSSTSNSCVSCSQMITNCASCLFTTYATCVTCNPGFFPSTTNLTCLQCPIQCATCDSTACITCNSGYTYNSSGTCTCDQTCQSCLGNSSNTCSNCTYSPFACTQCNYGFYLNTGSICSPCTAPCQQCIMNVFPTVVCLSCIPPFILDGFSNCVCNNTAGNYLSLNLSTCDACNSLAVIPNCQTCTGSSSTTCIDCLIGFYIGPGATSCQPCGGTCLDCNFNSTYCTLCLITYTMISTGVCDCNTTAQMFYNPLTGGCSPCATLIPKCSLCYQGSPNTSQTLCSSCSAPYYYQSTNYTCILCPSECASCLSPTNCLSCTSNFVLSQDIMVAPAGQCICNNSVNTQIFKNPASGTCQQCSSIIAGCSACYVLIGNIYCSSCVAGTYLSNNTCLNCGSTCATCNGAGCTTCPLGTNLVNGTCICDTACHNCENASPNCLNCTLLAGVIVNCYSCSNGFYLSSPDCLTCPSTCTTCTDLNTCLTCKPTYVLINGICACDQLVKMYPNNGICQLCSNIFYGCIDCSASGGSTVCLICQSGYFLSAGSCLPCSSTCLTCNVTNTTCTSCLSGYILSANTCSCSASCSNCSNVTSCATCIFTIFNVFSQCTSCQIGTYLDNLHQCQPCPPASNCVTCGSGGICMTCPQTFQVIGAICDCDSTVNMIKDAVSGNCVSCISQYPDCKTCIFNSSFASNIGCSICQDNYYLMNSTCHASVCGDGILTSGEFCDDNNILDNDGCNSYCTEQLNYVCTNIPFNSSTCILNLNFKIVLDSVTVSSTICNRISISFSLNPIYNSYEVGNFKNMLISVNISSIQLVSISYNNGLVKYEFDYLQHLYHKILRFYFIPANLGIAETATIPLITVDVNITSSNNIPALHFDSQICSSKDSVQSYLKFVEYGSYGVLILSALPAKIVGLELFGVLQLAFFSIANMNDVNTLLAPISEMKGVNGLNLDIDNSERTKNRLLQSTALTPERVQTIGYAANFLRNCNLMFLVVMAIILVALLLYIASYCFKKCAPSCFSISRRLAKEVLLTLILFNCYNFAYSAGLHFYYATPSDSLYALGTVAAVATIIIPITMAIALQCTQEEGFGQYKQKLKDGIVQKSYFVVTIAYRVGLGLYVSTMNEDEMSALIVMAISILFLMYNLINLPFVKAYHNYRANICHLAQFVCLFVTLYYRSMATSRPLKQVALVFQPVYIQLACIGFSLFISAAVLFYEIYLFIMNCKNKGSKINKQQSQNNDRSQQNNLNNTQEFQLKAQQNQKQFENTIVISQIVE